MSSEVAINVQGLHKAYQLFDSPKQRLLQLLYGERRQLFRSFVALDSVSLTMNRGDVVGIVGKNGSGKSTFLQLVCGTLTPSAGTVEVQGRVAALLELGAGFNPEFTGRENIYLAGAIAGLSKLELQNKIESIIEFSGVGAFIEQPVKTYSSGMYVRLAFSIAISVEPDILIIDEALSVGDGDFAKRSFDRIMQLKDEGKTILFCSHSLYQVESLCNRVVWLDQGIVRADGDPQVVVPAYQNFLDRSAAAPQEIKQPEISESTPTTPRLAREAWVVSVDLFSKTSLSQSGQPELKLGSGIDDLSVAVTLNYSSSLEAPPGVAIAIHTESGHLVTSCGSWEDGLILHNQSASEAGTDGVIKASVQVTFPRIPLLKGRYRLGVILFCERGLFPYEEIDPVAFFSVFQSSAARGVVALPRSWSHVVDEVSDRSRTPLSNDTKASLEAPPTELPDRLRAATSQDAMAVVTLFQSVFSQEVALSDWLSKFERTLDACYLLERAGEVVAFFGVVERRGYFKSQRVRFAQACDVMVAPNGQKGLGRHGDFYAVANSFISNHVGIGKDFDFAFGFPHDRAYRVAERLGLYRPAGEVEELRWSPRKPAIRKFGWRSVTGADRPLVEKLWQRMLTDAQDYAIGDRGMDHLVERFRLGFDSPYETLVVYRRFTGQVLGVAVLRRFANESRLELLDVIASRDNVKALLYGVKEFAASLGFDGLFCWATPAAANWFQGTGVTESLATGVIIPAANLPQQNYLSDITDHWWLMGGDTDFR